MNCTIKKYFFDTSWNQSDNTCHLRNQNNGLVLTLFFNFRALLAFLTHLRNFSSLQFLTLSLSSMWPWKLKQLESWNPNHSYHNFNFLFNFLSLLSFPRKSSSLAVSFSLSKHTHKLVLSLINYIKFFI